MTKIEELTKALAAQGYDARPSVKQFKKDSGVKEVSAAELDEAWAAYQAPAAETVAGVAAPQGDADTQGADKQTTPDKQPDPESAEPVEAIVVRTRGNQSRRRAGMRFSREPTTLTAGSLTEAQFLALLADGQLIIEPVID